MKKPTHSCKIPIKYDSKNPLNIFSLNNLSNPTGAKPHKPQLNKHWINLMNAQKQSYSHSIA